MARLFLRTAWPAIYAYLQRGGNLLTLGGRPFSHAAYRECDANNVCSWKLRYPRNAWAKALFINDYTETPGSKGLRQLANDDLPELHLPVISWKRAWSPTVRMSAEGLYPRIGTAGTIDMRLDPLFGERMDRINWPHRLSNSITSRITSSAGVG